MFMHIDFVFDSLGGWMNSL